MEIELSPEIQAKLERIASQQGRDTKSLVKEAVERLVDYDECFLRQVEIGLAQVDRGELLEQEEVAVRMKKQSPGKSVSLMQVRWSPAAADDLENIANYLFEKTPENAASLIREIYRTPAGLKDFPNRGRVGK
jgi:predicted transcriptional regulator